jgi:hypothetical protein
MASPYERAYDSYVDSNPHQMNSIIKERYPVKSQQVKRFIQNKRRDK